MKQLVIKGDKRYIKIHEKFNYEKLNFLKHLIKFNMHYEENEKKNKAYALYAKMKANFIPKIHYKNYNLISDHHFYLLQIYCNIYSNDITGAVKSSGELERVSTCLMASGAS